MSTAVSPSKPSTNSYWKDMMEEVNIPGEPEIPKMFIDCTVLITGATGFMGKLLIEKLLRSCPDIKKIYLIVRPKKNKDINKRVEEMFQDVVFSKLMKQQPNFMKKIDVISGEMSKLELGLSQEDRNLIINEVNFIFHCAATVRFNERLKTAVAVNVRGTREMMLLARDCLHLKSLVHVSTAFSNAPLDEIEERFYDVKVSGDLLIQLADSLDAEALDKMTPGLLGEYPNTYTYTKAAAENIVLQFSKGVPVAVVRPSIILSTYKEPLDGWNDNIYGPGGMVMAIGFGVLRVLRCAPEKIVDIVPGDYSDTTSRYGNETPPLQSMYMIMLFLVQSKFWATVLELFLHWIPAYIIDGLAYLSGKEPRLVNVYKKVDAFSKALNYFTDKEWVFHNDNTVSLYNELSKADQEVFSFDYESMDWDEYLRTYLRGVRAYLMKESPETIPAALEKQKKLTILHYVLCTVLAVLNLSLFWWFFKLVF